ncbi:hypothetical protein HY68_36550 [Streptomyces sp. AcH 505]|uniref:hypothetical protein n=1 Tax=Streptomyces sp. AcH 505 TaxID=352211 RepID=UPI000592156E|nr:hypothetical protein HY68_36550 [Streptomyces sp. AcH 505]
MDQAPTPDKKALYERLEQAIAAVTQAEEYDGILTEWVVLTVHHRVDAEGDSIPLYGKLLPGGGGRAAIHWVLGLVGFQYARLRAAAAESDED